ncbi:unnamed protein product [Coregonus sp. 'balchen']|nr:unnamed protein product [Coregonus sp. 'balchen']
MFDVQCHSRGWGYCRFEPGRPLPDGACLYCRPAAALPDHTSSLLCPGLKASLMARLARGPGLRTCSQPLHRKPHANTESTNTHSSIRNTQPDWPPLVSSTTVDDPTPTLQGDNQDTLSGGGAYDVTTKDPFKDMTERVFTFAYEDTTHSQAMNEGEGVLGPGAVTAIVIAVVLGASVLLALIVITLRKFTAS